MSHRHIVPHALSRRAALRGGTGVLVGSLAVGAPSWASARQSATPAATDGDALAVSVGPTGTVYRLDHWNHDTFTYLPLGENGYAVGAVTFVIGPDGSAERVTIEHLDKHGQGTFMKDAPAE